MRKSEVRKMKMVKNYVISGEIELKTGLHIGGLKETVEIGGADSLVIRTYRMMDESGKDVRLLPYIPGSSLKGKMRALLEYSTPGVKIKDKRDGNDYVKIGESFIKYPEGCLIPKIFGLPAEADKVENAPRAVFRDAMPTKDTIEWWDKRDILDGAEIKPENSINRLTSKPNPRQFERVPPGSKFEFEIVLTLYESDDPKEYMKTLLTGMKLLEDNYLGGSGTRGYGKIRFKKLKIVEKDIEYYREEVNEEKVIYEAEGDQDVLNITEILKNIQ